jgi:3-methyladenine DNA glycosylase AlkD
MSVDVWTERERIVGAMKAAARPGTWKKLQAYLGSPVPALGLSTPQLRAEHKQFQKDHPLLTTREVNLLAAAMWSGRTWEEKVFGIGLLDRNRELLDERSWSMADTWVDEATGWGLCDGLASGPVSYMVHSKPKRFAAILRWTKAKNFWRRRASTYALNEFIRAGELEKPFTLLERLLYDEEFWVQRAVGTWLRECWKKDERRTAAFLRRHVRGLPPVTITVATERAPKAFREELRRKSKTAQRKRR